MSNERGGDAVGVGLVLGALVSQMVGAALAARVFPQAGAAGMVGLRLGLGAVLMCLICRPKVRGYRRADWQVILGFGAVLACMNLCFYQAIARIPLGAAVALEVLGPLTLSVVASKRASSWMWAALAAGGVALLGRGGFDELDPIGVGFVLVAGALWACYILLAARSGSRFPKTDGIALALAVSAAISLPVGIADAGTRLLNPVVLVIGTAVAVLASALPYTLELLALRKLTPATFAVLTSLAPALAAAAGFFLLDQTLALTDIAAIGLVVAACAGAVSTPSPKPVVHRPRAATPVPVGVPE
ncbi:inner membrane transporter RhtA [Actinokineospora baliensis]|uniref:EamA family transporter n=1 Tax=Actinokineospora baliensis TaxID=547056 RepID=UPI0027DE7AC7|nr:EamA family transporter [Actinokineospora baliensis]MBM7772349.1 inner membrane transporter RhtA [Actinokineospora baliensis]